MRITVVIIVYNLEAFIVEAIDSVLRQTRPADEIIVVDDCSTDRSWDLVKSYGEQLRYTRMPENSGALLTALRGIKEASGDVISMLDGDDYWAANKLEVVEREFLADPDLVLLSHNHVRVNEFGTQLPIRDETQRNIACIRRRANCAHPLSDLLRKTVLDQQGYWLGSAYSFRRRCFDVSKFEQQMMDFGRGRLKETYLDLVAGPFLVLMNPKGTVGYAADTTLFYRVHQRGSLAGNVTPEKAIKSARKGRTINELIESVLLKNDATVAHLERRRLILSEYDFLLALYGRQSRKAAHLYFQLACRYWNWEQLKKETIRLLGVLILGPNKFLAMVNIAQSGT